MSDEKDNPYLAVALSKNIAIWSDDKVFEEQDEVEVYTTEQLLEIINLC